MEDLHIGELIRRLEFLDVFSSFAIRVKIFIIYSTECEFRVVEISSFSIVKVVQESVFYFETLEVSRCV